MTTPVAYHSRRAGPYLRGREEGTSAAATIAYEAWRAHHEGCPTCGEHDWFDPGAPRLEKQEIPGLTWCLKLEDGREVFYVNGPDRSVLCGHGSGLFRAWQEAAMRQGVLQPRGRPLAEALSTA